MPKSKYPYSLINLSLSELVSRADKTRRKYCGTKLDLCSILNAKSGLCSQDCKFCAQSAAHSTGIEPYPLKSKEEIVRAARRAKEIGAKRFGIVTSGNTLSGSELEIIAGATAEITREIGIAVCASLGEMSEHALKMLKKAGLSRYHHNIETSKRFFSSIVSTHTFDDRIRTIKAAKNVGLEVCSGGIIGLGETMEDRLDMALCLKKLGVDSVPVNVLVAIEGTALGDQPALSCEEVVRTIAIFRIILKDKVVKIAAGRESVLKDFQGLAFLGGANGMLIGGYLTVKGRTPQEDTRLIEDIKKLWKN